MTVVADNTAASQVGLRRGDVIKKVLMDDVHSRAELEQRLQKMQQRGQRNAALYVGGVNNARWLTIALRLQGEVGTNVFRICRSTAYHANAPNPLLDSAADFPSRTKLRGPLLSRHRPNGGAN